MGRNVIPHIFFRNVIYATYISYAFIESFLSVSLDTNSHIHVGCQKNTHIKKIMILNCDLRKVCGIFHHSLNTINFRCSLSICYTKMLRIWRRWIDGRRMFLCDHHLFNRNGEKPTTSMVHCRWLLDIINT